MLQGKQGSWTCVYGLFWMIVLWIPCTLHLLHPTQYMAVNDGHLPVFAAAAGHIASTDSAPQAVCSQAVPTTRSVRHAILRCGVPLVLVLARVVHVPTQTAHGVVVREGKPLFEPVRVRSTLPCRVPFVQLLSEKPITCQWDPPGRRFPSPCLRRSCLRRSCPCPFPCLCPCLFPCFFPCR